MHGRGGEAEVYVQGQEGVGRKKWVNRTFVITKAFIWRGENSNKYYMLSTQKSYGLYLKLNGENLKDGICLKIVLLWVWHCWDRQVCTWEMK